MSNAKKSSPAGIRKLVSDMGYSAKVSAFGSSILITSAEAQSIAQSLCKMGLTAQANGSAVRVRID